jgi:hypothetical protein
MSKVEKSGKARKILNYFKEHKLEFGTALSKVLTRHLDIYVRLPLPVLNSDVNVPNLYFRLNFVTYAHAGPICERCNHGKSAFDIFCIFIATFHKII